MLERGRPGTWCLSCEGFKGFKPFARLANGRLETPNNERHRVCRQSAFQALQCWNADFARNLVPLVMVFEPAVCQGFKGFKGLKAWQTAGSRVPGRNKFQQGYVQAKGRLQCWNADGQELGASGEGFRGFKGLKAGKRQARMP